jgi:ADP-ribose pyrophosphatase
VESLPQVVSSRVVYTGNVVSMRVDEITLPGGGTAQREVVQHPGAVVVAAVDDDGMTYLVRQYRHPVGAYLTEFPAGCMEAGEDPLEAAKRELREEVGLEAEDWISLGSFYSSPGFVNERLHAFVARRLQRVESDPDDDEDITVIRYPVKDLFELPGYAPDAKTLAVLSLLFAESPERSEAST